MLFEVRDERCVSEVLQARGIVGHPVGIPWDEVCYVTVSVLALVRACVVAQSSSGTVAGDGASADSGDRRRVVGEVGEGSIADRVTAGHQGDLSQEAGMF